jgi:hypothetical protein
MCRIGLLLLSVLIVTCPPARGADDSDAEKIGKLPHIEFYPKKKQVRVECEMLGVNAPLEFFCCVKGTNDYEAMIRSEVKPSDLHLALLAIGLKPGEPVHFSESLKKWFPPTGPPLHMTMEYEKDGQTVREPAWKWMRDVKTKKTAPPFTWVFTGSRVMPDGKYAADVTGYLVTVVNFDLSVIDVPELASSSNDLLEWERNPDVTPKAGTKVWMVIEPAGDDKPRGKTTPATRPARGAHSEAPPASAPSHADALIKQAEERVEQLKSQWEQKVAAQRDALREAAQAHYQIMADLRGQQQKLVDAADRIQRTIDELEKQYQDLTTPRSPSP